MPSGSIHAHRREVCYSRSASRWPSAARPNRTHARSSGERSDDRRNTLICRISVVSVVRTWHQFSRRDCSLAGTALALFTLFRAIPCDRNHTGAPCCRGTEGHHTQSDETNERQRVVLPEDTRETTSATALRPTRRSAHGTAITLRDISIANIVSPQNCGQFVKLSLNRIRTISSMPKRLLRPWNTRLFAGMIVRTRPLF
jgi:hypothetical protein